MFPTACGGEGPRARGRQPRDPGADAGHQVSTTGTDLNGTIAAHLFLWLPCFHGGTGFPFTVLIIISPFKINVSGNGESVRGKTGDDGSHG